MLRKTLLTTVLAIAVSTAWAQSSPSWNQGHEGNSFISKTAPSGDINREKPEVLFNQNNYPTNRMNGAGTPTQNPNVLTNSRDGVLPTTRIGWHLFLGYTYVRNHPIF